jgi:predicted MFS family arabinose efflux permease
VRFERIGKDADLATMARFAVEPSSSRLSTGSSSPLRAFAHRDFVLLCSGAFISNVGIWMERVAVGVWVTQTTGRAAATGLVTAMLFLPVAVLGPLGGAWSDRVERRVWLRNLSLVQAAVAAALAALATLGWLNVPLVSLLMFLTGCTSVMVHSGFTAAMAELVPRDDLTSAVFLNSAQWNLARLVGPLLAAPVVASGNTALAFWLNALSFLAVIGAALRMRPGRVPTPGTQGSLRESLAAGLTAVRSDAAISSALAITALAGFFVSPFIGLVPVFALQTLQAGAAAASLLVTAQGLGAVTAALGSAALLDRVGAAAWLKATCAVLCVLTVGFWLSPTLAVALAAMVALGAAYVSLVASAGRVCMGRAPPGVQARVASLFHVTLDTTYALGLMTMGALADAVGLRRVGVAGAVLFGLAVVGLARSRRHLFSALG